MPENVLPWETPNQEYASNLATPAVIMVDASNGASDYGKIPPHSILFHRSFLPSSLTQLFFFSLLYTSRLLSYLLFILSFCLSFLPSYLKLLNLFLSSSLIGNKYGEPVVCGFARSFGQRLPNKERVEWIKPIMFTAGLGWLDSRHTSKGKSANLCMKREDRR